MSGVPNAESPGGMDIAAGDGSGVDGGTATDGAGARASDVGGAGAPAGSGPRGEAEPVAPIAPTGTGGAGSANGPTAASSGGSGGGGNAASLGGGAGGAAGVGGVTSNSGAGGGPGAALCSAEDACGDCLCEACEEPLADCSGTPGCLEIMACARNSGCVGFACYCGSVDLITCATSDLADGPCTAVMLAAAGSHPPSISDPNAGPASEAALSLGNCSRQLCASPCGG